MDVIRVRFKEGMLRWCSLAAELHHVEREIVLVSIQGVTVYVYVWIWRLYRGYIEGCARVGSLCFLFSLDLSVEEKGIGSIDQLRKETKNSFKVQECLS